MKRGKNITYRGCLLNSVSAALFLPTVDVTEAFYWGAVKELFKKKKASEVILHVYMNHNNANVCVELEVAHIFRIKMSSWIQIFDLNKLDLKKKNKDLPVLQATVFNFYQCGKSVLVL